MDDKQKAVLLQVIAEWAGIMNDSMASARIAQLKFRTERYLVRMERPN